MPDLFCATASASGAGGLRYVLHGSPGNSLFDTAKFRALGGLDPAYDTREVAIRDLCYRAWQRGWPTVAVAGMPLHDGVQTGGEDLDHLRFLARAVSDPKIFRHGWAHATERLRAAGRGAEARAVLWRAPAIALRGGPSGACDLPEALFLALTDGSVTVYPGKAHTGKPRVLVASAHLPFPLSHGGAVRMHNLTLRAAADWDQILVAFTENDAPPAAELLDRFVEVVLVRRAGTHAVPSTGRPEVVEHFASAVLPRGPAGGRAQVAARHRATGVHADGPIRRRLRARPRPSWWNTTLPSISTSNCARPATIGICGTS